MSNDKPTATATIRFYANKHVDVSLTTIKGITPRTLDIASNILLKTYRGMKGKFIADEHRKARKRKAAKEVRDAKTDEDFHEKEDIRLLDAARAKFKALGLTFGKSDESNDETEEE